MTAFPPDFGLPLWVERVGLARVSPGLLIPFTLPKRGSSTRAWLRRERAREHEASSESTRRYVRELSPSYRCDDPDVTKVVACLLPEPAR